MKKLSLILAALAAFVLFSGCALINAALEDSKYEKCENAVFIGYKTVNGDSEKWTWTFEENEYCYLRKIEYTQYDNFENPIDFIKAKHKGSAAKDGTVKITIKKTRQPNGTGGYWLYDYDGPDKEFEITISDGKFTYDGIEYTRQ